MKLAEVLVVGSDLSRIARLRDVTSVSPEGLEPYQEEILSIERMYLSIWQFHVYVDSSWSDKQPVVAWALEQELGFPNDKLLMEELSHETESLYGILAGELRGEIAPNHLSRVIERVDADFVRMRHGPIKDPRARLLSIIRGVTAEAAGDRAPQLELPGM